MKAVAGVLVAIAVAGVLGYCTGRKDGRAAVKTDTERAIDSALAVRAAVVETIQVHAPAVAAAVAASDSLARVVRITGAAELTVQLTPTAPATIVPVPPAVVGRIRQDSITIVELRAQLRRYQLLVREDSTTIRLQDVRIAELERERRCGAKCGAALAVGGIIAIAAAVKYGDALLDQLIPGQRPRPITLSTIRGF